MGIVEWMIAEWMIAVMIVGWMIAVTTEEIAIETIKVEAGDLVPEMIAAHQGAMIAGTSVVMTEVDSDVVEMIVVNLGVVEMIVLNLGVVETDAMTVVVAVIAMIAAETIGDQDPVGFLLVKIDETIAIVAPNKNPGMTPHP